MRAVYIDNVLTGQNDLETMINMPLTCYDTNKCDLGHIVVRDVSGLVTARCAHCSIRHVRKQAYDQHKRR